MVRSSQKTATHTTSPLWRLLQENCVTVTLWKLITQTILTFWKVDWPQNKPLWKGNCQSFWILELRNNNTCNKNGSRNNWPRSKTFCAVTKIKFLYHLCRQTKNWLVFTTTKISTGYNLVVLYQTWPIVVYINLPLRNSIPSLREKKL